MANVLERMHYARVQGMCVHGCVHGCDCAREPAGVQASNHVCNIQILDLPLLLTVCPVQIL